MATVCSDAALIEGLRPRRSLPRRKPATSRRRSQRSRLKLKWTLNLSLALELGEPAWM